jgi:hypothetical protein
MEIAESLTRTCEDDAHRTGPDATKESNEARREKNAKLLHIARRGDEHDEWFRPLARAEAIEALDRLRRPRGGDNPKNGVSRHHGDTSFPYKFH